MTSRRAPDSVDPNEPLGSPDANDADAIDASGALPKGHRLAAALEALPLFPLPEVVLFPRAILPLHVFEPRYRAMLRDALRTHGALAVVQLAPFGAATAGATAPAEASPSDHPPIARIAGAGLVIEHEPLADGRSNILVQGIARVALEEIPFDGPYRRARARVLEDAAEPVSEGDLAALVHAATRFAGEVKRRDPRFSFRLSPSAPGGGGALADTCAFHLVIDAAARQAILEELDPRRRVQRVIAELSAQSLELEPQKTRGAAN